MDNYAPPPGPPPSHRPGAAHGSGQDDYAPPPGPPPSQPKHDWEAAVPDTSLFPPPPDIFSGWDRSPASNATEAQAEAGEQWCAAHPLTPRPVVLDAASADAHRRRDVNLLPPQGQQPWRGRVQRLGAGVWRGTTERSSGDGCLIGWPPLYAVGADSPLGGGGSKTVYYEVRALPESPRPPEGEGVPVAIGYAALPYPAFRMPGWHRGSLAVHGDDGHRYVNDRWGGKSFTQPVRRGETVGLGITFTPGGEGGRTLGVEIFLTRDGREAGRWSLHEETDAQQDLPVTGLEGFHDLSCAVGTYGQVAFEVVFEPSRWAFKGVQL